MLLSCDASWNLPETINGPPERILRYSVYKLLGFGACFVTCWSQSLQATMWMESPRPSGSPSVSRNKSACKPASRKMIPGSFNSRRFLVAVAIQ